MEKCLLIIICILYYYRSHPNRRHRDYDVYKCLICRGYHALRFCSKFLQMDYKEKNRMVRKYEYCINCLARSHTFRKCKSKNTCRKCKRYHHTLLHPVYPRITPPSRQEAKLQYRKKSSQRNKRITAQPSPDPLILSEAIKSIATVLCATQVPASMPSPRHV